MSKIKELKSHMVEGKTLEELWAMVNLERMNTNILYGAIAGVPTKEPNKEEYEIYLKNRNILKQAIREKMGEMK